MLMIAAGYEDGNDANTLRGDPMFKLGARSPALERGIVLAIDRFAAEKLA